MPKPVILSPLKSEAHTLKALLKSSDVTPALRKKIETRAVELVKTIREESDPSMMELFLGEYGLSSDEGIALMCLAEALLRVPDDDTMDALIEDKVAPSAWGQHLGKSHSSLVNASTWALFITGKVLGESENKSIASTLHEAIKRLGEPVIRQAVSTVMKEMGRQFVLGETIEKAIARAHDKEAEGFTYSYDMLGEAARTDKDARRYHLAYSDAICEIAKAAHSDDIRENPGISIKLSALHSRYETIKKDRVMEELVPRAHSLAILAKSAGVGLNIDAEEAGRLELSLDIIEAVLSDPAFENWDGFGVVVQAYGKRATEVLDFLYNLATKLDRKIMVRLVKGAYWDTEIKLSQIEGHTTFPVFTRKPSTDVSYICCAQKLLGMTDRIYPQFATHNAHTVSAILEMANDTSKFEFQRLHGMGDALHDVVLKNQKTRCRIYAPVGAHKDLLAYLVRRLLENGANSSFVNQIVDEEISPQMVAADPFLDIENYIAEPHNPAIKMPDALFKPERKNSIGYDLTDPAELANLEKSIAAFDKKQWKYKNGTGEITTVSNPATGESVGKVQFATEDEANKACEIAKTWADVTVIDRAKILNKAADLYEENAVEIFSLLMREAGKTLLDCVGELREAVDFLRYYAAQAKTVKEEPAGIFTCIAPWNFPLAIFTGQLSAALAVGNGVVAKPAEATNLIANFACSLLWQAGVPKRTLQLVTGLGHTIGATLTANANIDGVCFTGSTATAQHINRSIAKHLSPHAPLIAETGGLNAMIVDSTALPEQAITDVIASAFQSAGQRCSALRALYLQDDIADSFLEMLYGAIDELSLGDPRKFTTDIGPIIDKNAATKFNAYIKIAHDEGRLLKQTTSPDSERFIPPTVLRIDGIEDLAEEIFGPVLHVARYQSKNLDKVISAVNATGYGLTFGLHSRIDDRVQHIVENVHAGNIYINRNQIGAVVGSQPFGGDGLSGTGPKAGGPKYLHRFVKPQTRSETATTSDTISLDEIERAFLKLEKQSVAQMHAMEMPGPTGESNQYSLHPRGRVLCLGPTVEMATEQASRANTIGCKVLAIGDKTIAPETLAEIKSLDAVISWSDNLKEIREALAKRDGQIIPLFTQSDFEKWLLTEKHVCIDTTAAGGNAALLEG